MYIYELADWPAFRWDEAALAAPLAQARHRQGRLLGSMASLGFPLRSEAVFQTLTEDALKTSEIEGELLDKHQVRSSLARRLGLRVAGMVAADRRVDGLVHMLLDATQSFEEPLTRKRLLHWHAELFPDRGGGRHPMAVGKWRTDSLGPMQVVSGPLGRERVHFQAPPAKRIEAEMASFLRWFESPSFPIDPVMKAAVAHIWFVTIHPFDDGNGRVARAIHDLALARSEATTQRFYSMSARLRIERKSYYATLEKTQKGRLDITAALAWFIGVFDRALADAETALGAVLAKAAFWQDLAGEPINDRQRAMLNRLLDEFSGKLTSSKWATMTKVSQDTALRDIDDLIARRILVKEAAGGRSTSYALAQRSIGTALIAPAPD